MDGLIKSAFEEVRTEPCELFCRDFDIHCFDVPHPDYCKAGRTAIIGDTLYYTMPVRALCPLCDPIHLNSGG